MQDQREKLNSRGIADRFAISRDQAERFLTDIGIRSPSDDGAVVYSVHEVEQRFAERDADTLKKAAIALDPIRDEQLAHSVVTDAFDDLRAACLRKSGAIQSHIDEAKRAVLHWLRHTYGLQHVQSLGGDEVWAELTILRRFESQPIAALAERRTPRDDGSVPKPADPTIKPTPTESAAPKPDLPKTTARAGRRGASQRGGKE